MYAAQFPLAKPVPKPVRHACATQGRAAMTPRKTGKPIGGGGTRHPHRFRTWRLRPRRHRPATVVR